MKPECVVITGPSGCGKTRKLTKLLETERFKAYHLIYIICPTFYVNESYRDWYVKMTGIIPKEIEVEELDDTLQEIISGKHPLLKIAIVVDDMSFHKAQHSSAYLRKLSQSGRHYLISLFLLTQDLHSISPAVRKNITRLIFFRTHFGGSIKILRDEFLGLLDKEEKDSLILKLRNGGLRTHVDLKLGEKFKVCVYDGNNEEH